MSKNDNQDAAKYIWILETINSIQGTYIEAFNTIKKGEYNEGWRILEQCEIHIIFLEKHFDITSDEKFHLLWIKNTVKKIQSIFPYTWFMSTEMLEKKIKCGICGEIISIRRHCGHEVGQIYDGKMCTRIIEDMELLGIAFVQNPVNRYSVGMIVEPSSGKSGDNYDYTLVKYLFDRLYNPEDLWDVEETKKRNSHERFAYLGRNDKCPCESGKKYKKCCMLESGVLLPHHEFSFSHDIPLELQKTIYT